MTKLPLALLGLLLLYLLAWPVPIDPVAWKPGPNPGFEGTFARNEALAALERVSVPDSSGPEDLTAAPDGTLFTTSKQGFILRRAPGGDFQRWVDTRGRPLGLDWDETGDRLVVADAYRGLLAVTSSGAVEILATEADGRPILYADDVVAARDGKLYFTDASTKFGAQAWGGTYPASLLDILEHGDNGRVLVFDPATARTETFAAGLSFANGIALDREERGLLVVETGSYRVLRYSLEDRRAPPTVVIGDLPGYPDNLTRCGERYWLGLVSSRRAVIDETAELPFVRKILQRLPSFLRPEASRYAHVIAFDENGTVLANLQDHAGEAFARTTGALEHEGSLWVTSLHEPDLARLPDFTPPKAEAPSPRP